MVELEPRVRRAHGRLLLPEEVDGVAIVWEHDLSHLVDIAT